MIARPLTVLAFLSVCFAGCGATSSDGPTDKSERATAAQQDEARAPERDAADERLVRDALAKWMLASMRQDIPAMCRTLTVESRKLIAEKGRESGAGDSCAAALRAHRQVLAAPRPGTPEGAASAARTAPVEIDGNRATAELDGERLPLRREGDAWRLDLAGALGLK